MRIALAIRQTSVMPILQPPALVRKRSPGTPRNFDCEPLPRCCAPIRPTRRTLHDGGLRPPSNAVPIRTCVAPAETASSGHRSYRPRSSSPKAIPPGRRPSSASPANASAAGTPSGATAMTPPSSRPSSAATASARAGTWSRGAPPRPGSSAVQADLDQAGQGPLLTAGRGAQRPDQPEPVHGVDDVRVADHAGRLVGLQLADEVPGELAQVSALRGLGGRLLVAVLPEVPLAELARAAGRPTPGGLGDGDQGELRRVAPGRGARRGDPGPDPVQPASEFSAPGRLLARPTGLAHLRKSGTSRSSSSSKTTDRRRVVAASKTRGRAAPGALARPGPARLDVSRSGRRVPGCGLAGISGNVRTDRGVGVRVHGRAGGTADLGQVLGGCRVAEAAAATSSGIPAAPSGWPAGASPVALSLPGHRAPGPPRRRTGCGRRRPRPRRCRRTRRPGHPRADRYAAAPGNPRRTRQPG